MQFSSEWNRFSALGEQAIQPATLQQQQQPHKDIERESVLCEREIGEGKRRRRRRLRRSSGERDLELRIVAFTSFLTILPVLDACQPLRAPKKTSVHTARQLESSAENF